MVRWIAFGDESAEAVVSRFKRGAAEIQEGDALAAALSLGRPSLVLLPSPIQGNVLVAHFEPKTETAASPSAEGEFIEFEPTGFLGLSDQPVFVKPRKPAQQHKKKWWQRRSA